jgi:hypothetical protein
VDFEAERYKHKRKGASKQEKNQEGSLYVQLLRQEAALLLDLSLRVPDLQHLHGGEPVGHDLQRGELAVPRLRAPEALLRTSEQ